MFVVIMQESKWDGLTARVQSGLLYQLSLTADQMVAETSRQQTDAYATLRERGFKFVVSKDKITEAATTAWKKALGPGNDLFLNEAIPIVEQQKKRPLLPENHGSVDNPKLTPSGPSNGVMLFATDRRDDWDRDPAPEFRFANAPEHLSFGNATVEIDPSRKLTGDRGSSRIVSISTFSEESFKAQLASDLTGTQRKEVLIFIHGYDNHFSDAAVTAAMLRQDLNFGGITMFYSWSSAGNVVTVSKRRR